MAEQTLSAIAHIRTEFPEKFGIPRQSGLVESEGRIVFEPKYRNPAALKGIEGFEYLWLLWQFEGGNPKEWSAVVRPPRLGGKETMGVFATRSPYRPNGIGLSSVRLLRVESTEEGMVLVVSGADLRDGTPILDIKPYLPYADSHPDAKAGFADNPPEEELSVTIPEELLEQFSGQQRECLRKLLAMDPRPRYGDSDGSRYGMAFAGKNIVFSVRGRDLTVHAVMEYVEEKGKRI